MHDFKTLLPQRSKFASLPPPLFSLPVMAILSTLLIVVFVVSQLVGTALFAPMVLPTSEPMGVDEWVLLGGENGTVVSLVSIFTLLTVMLSSWVFIKAKKGNLKEFLGLKAFCWRQLLGFGVVLLILNVLINGITIWLEREPMLFMDKIAVSAHPLWLLVVAIVLVVPIYEELIFRGFIWSGLASTRVGIWGASILTSLIFALIHIQYGAIEMAMIVALALLFSYTRALSGSLLLPMVLHMINNGLAMWQYLGTTTTTIEATVKFIMINS